MKKIFPVQLHADSEELRKLTQKRDLCLRLATMGEYGAALLHFRETITQFTAISDEEYTHVEFLERLCKNIEESVQDQAPLLADEHSDSVKNEFEQLVDSLYELNPKVKRSIRRKQFQAKREEFKESLNERLSDLAYDIRYVCKLQAAFSFLQMLVNNSVATGLIDVAHLWRIEKMFKNMEVVKLQTDGP